MPPKVTREPPTSDRSRLEFAALWNRALPRFRSVLITRVFVSCGPFSREQIDDLVGEVTEVVLSKAAEYDPSHGLVAWAMGCARRILANLPRRRKRQRRQVPISDLASSGDAAVLEQLIDPASDQPHRERLEGWLEQLPAENRRVIEGRYFQGFNYDELAAYIGVGCAATARVRLHRALNLLRSIAAHDAGGAV